MKITIEQATRASELREQNFSWEAIVRELGYSERREVSSMARKIRLAIDPEFTKHREEYEAKRNRSRAVWAYGSRRPKALDGCGRKIVGEIDQSIMDAARAFASGEIDAAELSARLRMRG